jgi:hypothetical protein
MSHKCPLPVLRVNKALTRDQQHYMPADHIREVVERSLSALFGDSCMSRASIVDTENVSTGDKVYYAELVIATPELADKVYGDMIHRYEGQISALDHRLATEIKSNAKLRAVVTDLLAKIRELEG